MSFTADIYKEILFDISAGTNQTQPFAMRRTAFNNGIVVVFAINVATKMRSAFLSVTSVISKCKFPHWKGVEIETATLPAYGSDTPFVALFQLPNSADDIFEIVVEDLRRQLKAAKCNADSLPVIINVLAKWKNFFASNKELVMTEKRQQGLYGELLFLSECLDSYGLESVSHWAGSEDETHDFYFGSHAVEVKTTSIQAPYFASISSEYQMDNSDLPGKLFLRFYALRTSQSGGETLPERVAILRGRLHENLSELQNFKAAIIQPQDLDQRTTFNNYCFSVEDGFPKITKSNLPQGVSELTYRISIALCIPYAQSIESVFKVLKGGNCCAKRKNP